MVVAARAEVEEGIAVVEGALVVLVAAVAELEETAEMVAPAEAVALALAETEALEEIMAALEEIMAALILVTLPAEAPHPKLPTKATTMEMPQGPKTRRRLVFLVCLGVPL
jgi:hypothetical protein